jgi:hypothetical protein
MALVPISQMVFAETPKPGYWFFTKAYSPTQLENLTFINVGDVSPNGQLVYPTWYLGRHHGTSQIIYLLNGTYDPNTGKLTFFQINSNILNRVFYTGHYFINPLYGNCPGFMAGTWERLFQGGFHASGGWFAFSNVTQC